MSTANGGNKTVGDVDSEHLITDEFIVPQIVKVVTLADNRNLHRFSNGGGVRSGNNIVLHDSSPTSLYHTPDPEPPPSFVDNIRMPPEPESILGLDPADYYDDDDDEDSELNHKYASFTLKQPAQPDDPVDFFGSSSLRKNLPTTASTSTSSSSSSSSFQTFTLLPTASKGKESNKGKSSSNSQVPKEEEEDEDMRSVTSSGRSSSCGGAMNCSTLWEELNFCQADGCGAPANKKCAQCKVAFYCSTEHHTSDWRTHRKQCTPYRVQYVGIEAGYPVPVSAAVACRNIPPGQVIFSEKPMLVFPLAESLSEGQIRSPLDLPCVRARMQGNATVPCDANMVSCLGCAKPNSVGWNPEFQCSKCGLPLCSYNCQLLTAHQAGECDAIHSINVIASPQTWSRCYHLLHMDIEILRALNLEKYNRSSWELLLEMKNSVRVDTYKQTERFRRFSANMNVLVPLSAKISGYNRDLIADVHAIINALSFRPNLNCPLKLLFLTQPQFIHDCVPNTFHFVEEEHCGDGSRMKLVTKAAVPILKGTPITVDLTPSPYLSYDRRRTVLTEILNMSNCMCQRCQHPSVMNDLTAEIKCYSCRMGTVCPETPQMWQESVWSCRICQEEISFSRIQDIERDCEQELNLILTSARKSGSVREVLDWIRRKGSLELNPKHHLIFTAWCYCEAILRRRVTRSRRVDPAHVYTLEEMNDFEVLGKYADILLEHMDSIRQGFWIDKGVAQFHKFYSLFAMTCKSYQSSALSPKEFVSQVMKAMKVLQSALTTFSLYEGYNSPTIRGMTQDATTALSSLKEYMARFLQLDQSTNPLPSMDQLLQRSQV